MPIKYQPDYIYLRHVQTSRVHYFTLMQIACSAVMWIIKSVKSTSIAFPLMVSVVAQNATAGYCVGWSAFNLYELPVN
jgi:HCO3- transporter family